MTEQQAIGKLTVLVQDDAFINGLQAGYLHFCVNHRTAALTESQIYDFFMRTICNILQDSIWNSGFLIGWCKALFETQPNVTLPLLLPQSVLAEGGTHA